MSKRDVPKLNRDKFLAWKFLMKLHLGGLGNHAQSIIFVEHVDPASAPTTKDIKRRRTQLGKVGDCLYPKLCQICGTAKKCGMLYTLSMKETQIFKEPNLKVLEVSLMI